MSTDWNIHCLDCESTHGFDDANHQVELMRTLIKHADAIAAMGPLLAESSVELRTYWGDVDPTWFATHRGHRLVPINEYREIDGQCREYAKCAHCGDSKKCQLRAGHEGDHDPKAKR